MNATVTQATAQVTGAPKPKPVCRYDVPLMVCVAILVTLGLTMVTSASMPMADRDLDQPLYYALRQALAVCIGTAMAVVTVNIPLAVWRRRGPLLLALTLILLVLVLVPNIGREVNGSWRWIAIGPISLQASEPAKLGVIIYLAGYLVRRGAEVRTRFAGFMKPIAILTLVSGLLLLEPDFGTTVVLFATAMGMIFLAGVPMTRFIAWGLVAVSALLTLAVMAPYRLRRLIAFLDPWSDPYGSGFQLTQALIAFGRGEWFGVGLGSSVQKLFYLPEVHTDFIFAVLAEELGLLGTICVIGLFTFLVWRAFWIGGCAERAGQLFSAYLAYGIALLIGIQAFINMGVNMGVLPTKGITLPLISYGSNSMVIMGVAIGLLLRVAREAGAQGDADGGQLG